MAPVSTDSPTVPAGQYKVVCLALDLTGKKGPSIEEICQIGAYYPSEQPKIFSQYVMPFRDISPSSIRAHGVRTFTTFGKYRVLKEAQPRPGTITTRTLKTKSEYSTLCDFMQWLKETKGESDGVILAYHDNNRETVTPFLLAALNRYKIADDFFNMVPGFLNVAKLARDISAEPDSELKDKDLTIRALTKHFKVLTTEEVKVKGNSALLMQSAKNRANYIYKVLQKLMKTEAEVEVGASSQIMRLCQNRVDVCKNLENQHLVTEKIRTLKPFFVVQMRKSSKDRSRAVELRRYLIDAEIDYAMLKKAYEDPSGAKDAVTTVISSTSAAKKEKDMNDLVEIIMSHFKIAGEKMQNGKGIPNGKEMGQGEPTITITTTTPNESATSASSNESDEEEFAEAQDEIAEK